ncbi:hypothetical protein QYM36_004559 [Artemia franciscana]|uniref:Uncharacterized protein n=1 Tax=Artemia franciscana TaxID=6661 RepID=A0AA88I3V3_ARTSF|nr:hypothetical protein QYM36_004559 [Artemia franciscana]
MDEPDMITPQSPYVDMKSALNEIDSDLSELSVLASLDDKEEDWTPPNERNQGDDAEMLSESVDQEDAEDA